VALAARDFLAPHIRRGGEDVEDRLLLVGDYAAALKRLQDRPPPGEHSADAQALRAMVERVGQHMPGSKPEFWYQSTELSRLLQDGLSTLAKGYVLQKVLPAGDPLATPLARSEKESISRLSERLVTTFEAGVKDTAGEKLGEAAWDTLQERTKKEWEEAGRRAAGKKEGSR
jgi:hypothetical protein